MLHYDAASVKATEAATPPDLVLKLFEHKGSMEEYRTYKNNLVFLVADEDQVGRMVDVAQQYLAIHRITRIPSGCRSSTRPRRTSSSKWVRPRNLICGWRSRSATGTSTIPSADAPRKTGNLAHQALQAEEQGKVQQDQTEVVLKALKNLEKVLTADDKPLNAQYVKAKAWTMNAVSVSTEDLRREFCKRLA